MGSEERILAVFDWLADWVHAPAFHGCLFIKAASEYPEPDDRPRQAAVAFKAACRQLLESLCQELGGRDPESAWPASCTSCWKGPWSLPFWSATPAPPSTPGRRQGCFCGRSKQWNDSAVRR